MFWRHVFSFPLTSLIDCKIDVNNNNPAGLEHCKLMASVVQYLITEGMICDNVKQYTVFVILINSLLCKSKLELRRQENAVHISLYFVVNMQMCKIKLQVQIPLESISIDDLCCLCFCH